MNKNPVNLAVRFLLEIAMLISLGIWGWHLFNGFGKYLAAILFPLTAAFLWGIFRIPNDPKPAPVKTPGIIRLLLELLLFSLAVYGLYITNHKTLCYIMAVTVLIHYGVSYDRTWAMLRNKEYKGFS
jgi:hypothetical protein